MGSASKQSDLWNIKLVLVINIAMKPVIGF